VDGVFSRRKILDVQRDFNAFRRAGKLGSAHALAFGIFEFHGYRFGSGTAMRILGLGRGSQSEEQTHPIYDCSHRDYLFL
jgi:hypothetical protein